MGCDGMGWDGMECEGMEWDGTGWNGMRWEGGIVDGVTSGDLETSVGDNGTNNEGERILGRERKREKEGIK